MFYDQNFKIDFGNCGQLGTNTDILIFISDYISFQSREN